ncbi:nucleoid-associated protein Lsr2 (plasmid) [Mycobacterium paragordonae]|nr:MULTISPECIES: Lsr2 family protein [Mycobacterium]AYE99555.1 nucleoid-associated protein Lsr2 [Mycobacterium paragordonae]QNI15293.1 Lsr2 family protein [Mycobacterium kubicae]
MAKHVSVMLVDDYDGTSEARETVNFAVDGCSYEIDLNVEHATQLRADIGQWASRARRVKGGRGGQGRPRMPTEEGVAIRQWARGHGHAVAARGRIPAKVIKEYNAAVGAGE